MLCISTSCGYIYTQVHEVHVDTRLRAPLPVYPQHAPTLRTIEPRDPVAMENAGHGPKAMTTEYHSQFPRKKLSDDGVCGLFIIKFSFRI